MCFVVVVFLRPWVKDRFFSPDIETATQLLLQGKVISFGHCSIYVCSICDSTWEKGPNWVK